MFVFFLFDLMQENEGSPNLISEGVQHHFTSGQCHFDSDALLRIIKVHGPTSHSKAFLLLIGIASPHRLRLFVSTAVKCKQKQTLETKQHKTAE